MKIILLLIFLVGCAHTHEPPPVDPCSFEELSKTINAFPADELTSTEMQTLAGGELSLCEMERTTQKLIESLK